MSQCTDPDHDCFTEASLRVQQATTTRVGWVLYVDDDSNKPSVHMRGNTTFLAAAVMDAAQRIVDHHESTGCAHCDVAFAGLVNAIHVYRRTKATAAIAGAPC